MAPWFDLRVSRNTGEALDAMHVRKQVHSEVPEWRFPPGIAPIFGTTRVRFRTVTFAEDAQVIPEVQGQEDHGEVYSLETARTAMSTAEEAVEPMLEARKCEENVTASTSPPRRSAETLKRVFSVRRGRKIGEGSARSMSSDEGKPEKKRSRFEERRNGLMEAASSCLRRRTSFGSEVDYPHVTQSQATEGKYLPHIAVPRRTLGTATPRVSTAAADSLYRDMSVRNKQMPRRRKNALQPAPQRRSHCLKPCGHTIRTATPSPCGSNCGCHRPSSTQSFSPASLTAHPCAICIDNILKAKYAKTRKTVRRTTAAQYQAHNQSKTSHAEVQDARKAAEYFEEQLKNLDIIWQAQRTAEKKNTLTRQVQAHGAGAIYLLDPASEGTTSYRAVHTTRQRTRYRGVDRGEDLARVAVRAHVVRSIEAYGKARRRCPVVCTASNDTMNQEWKRFWEQY